MLLQYIHCAHIWTIVPFKWVEEVTRKKWSFVRAQRDCRELQVTTQRTLYPRDTLLNLSISCLCDDAQKI
jgi:hypothetical protein